MNKTIQLLNGLIQMKVSEEMEEMDAEKGRKMFLGGTPQELYEDTQHGIFLTAMQTETALSGEEVKSRLVAYHDAYRNSVPNFANFSIAQKQLTDGTTVGAFYYTSTFGQRKLFNFFVLLPVDGKETVLTMHCEEKDSLTMGRQFMSFINSIEVL